MQVDFASWSKAKAKPQRRESDSSSTKTIPIGERTWTDVEPREYSISDYEVSKKLIRLLSSWKSFSRKYGAIEFWRIKDNLQKHFLYCHHWSDDKWKKSMARGGRNQEKIPVLYWFIRSNLVPPSSSKVIQDAVSLILLYRTMSLFRTVSSSTFIMSDVQSIYFPSSIQDWYREVKIWATNRQYSFCLWIPWTRDTKILIRSTWMNRVLHNTCIKQGRNHTNLFKTIERYHPSRNTPSLLHSESCSDGSWTSHRREGICVTSASSQDVLETWLDERFGFRSCSTTRWTSSSTI